jgi:hypothetical protein
LTLKKLLTKKKNRREEKKRSKKKSNLQSPPTSSKWSAHKSLKIKNDTIRNIVIQQIWKVIS